MCQSINTSERAEILGSQDLFYTIPRGHATTRLSERQRNCCSCGSSRATGACIRDRLPLRTISGLRKGENPKVACH